MRERFRRVDLNSSRNLLFLPEGLALTCGDSDNRSLWGHLYIDTYSNPSVSLVAYRRKCLGWGVGRLTALLEEQWQRAYPWIGYTHSNLTVISSVVRRQKGGLSLGFA